MIVSIIFYYVILYFTKVDLSARIVARLDYGRLD
jgi:hypothetical protein